MSSERFFLKQVSGSAGDFLISKALVEDLSSAAGYRKLHQLCEAGHYVVVPAFEVLLDKSVSAGRSSDEARLEVALRRARAVVTQSKLQLLKALPQGWLAPFGFWRNFTHGHGPTDFTRCAPVCCALVLRPTCAPKAQQHGPNPCPNGLVACHAHRPLPSCKAYSAMQQAMASDRIRP